MLHAKRNDEGRWPYARHVTIVGGSHGLIPPGGGKIAGSFLESPPRHGREGATRHCTAAAAFALGEWQLAGDVQLHVADKVGSSLIDVVLSESYQVAIPFGQPIVTPASFGYAPAEGAPDRADPG